MKILIILFAMLPLITLAQTQPDIAKMSQQQLLDYQRGLIAAQKATSQSIDINKVESYIDIGEKYGEAVRGVIQGVGEGGDEFLKTTTGKITVVAVLWKIMGRDALEVTQRLAQYFFGSLFFLIAIPTWLFFTKRAFFGYRRVTKSGPWYSPAKEYEYIRGRCDLDDFGYTMGFAAMFLVILGIGNIILWA